MLGSQASHQDEVVTSSDKTSKKKVKTVFSFVYLQTSEEFLQTYVKPSKNNSDLYVPFVFDSVWTIALTLNNSMHQINTTLNRSLADFTYKDSSMAKILKQTLENLEFQGITVKIDK